MRFVSRDKFIKRCEDDSPSADNLMMTGLVTNDKVMTHVGTGHDIRV